MKPTLKAALEFRKDGVSCIPVSADKVPLVRSWRKYMTELPTEEEQGQWFSNGAGIALLGGKYQCIDIDEKYESGLMENFKARLIEAGLKDILNSCVIQSTPSGGYHLIFQTQCQPFRNMKLASKSADEGHETLIETRGDGGYFLIEPSQGYKVIQGDFNFLPVLTEEEREDLLDVARSFNRKIKDDEQTTLRPDKNKASKPKSRIEQATPGDDFDQRGDIAGLLKSHGWTPVGKEHWRRPGKTRGISASLNHVPGRFYVFSTSTQFEPEKPYKPYAVYAMLEHGGDYKRAMSELARQGYGTPMKKEPATKKVVSTTQEFVEETEKPEFEIKRFDELQRQDDNDWNNIIGNRFLCRGACAMLFGYSGVGKSSLITQISHCWALGKETLGLKPARPLNILLIQAENDEGDLAEMRDGGIEGMIKAGLLTPKQAECAQRFVYTVRISSKCGAQVGLLLEMVAPGFDLVILDPLFAYLGGDASNQKDVSFFLRNVIDPVVARLNIALLIVHHTNKPPQDGKQSSKVADMAYLSAGSAELTNYPRGILAILPTQRSDVFAMVAAKRGNRLTWGKLHDGRPRRKRYIGHADGYICWNEIDDLKAERMFKKEENSIKAVKKELTADQKEDQAVAHLKTLIHESVWETDELHTKLETVFGLGIGRRRSAIKRAAESVPGTDRVRPKAGRCAPEIIGPMQKVIERKDQMEKEFESNKQQKLIND